MLRKACSFSVSRSRMPPAAADTRMRWANLFLTSMAWVSVLRFIPGGGAQFAPCSIEGSR